MSHAVRLAFLVAAVCLPPLLASPKPADPPPKADAKPHYYKGVEAVCIGIDYKDYPKDDGKERVNPLPKAPDDARRFADTLNEHYGIGQATLLLNDKATKKAIFAALDEIDSRTDRPEAVILYFAGHGQSFLGNDPRVKGDNAPVVSLGYLIPHGATFKLADTSKPETWDAEAIDMRDLTKRVHDMKVQHVVLFVDACCSGYMTKRGTVARPDVVRLLSEKSRTVVTATTQKQAAIEESTGGVFTTALVDALTAAANNLDSHRVTDIHARVYDAVTAKQKATMSPQLRQLSSEDGEFVFIPKRVSAKDVGDLRKAIERAKTVPEPPKPSEVSAVLEGDTKRGNQLRAAVKLSDVCKAMDAPDYRFSADPEKGKAEWEKRKEKFEEAAGHGDVFGMAGLFFCYAKGLGTKKSPEQAYQWALQADLVEKPAGVGQFLLAHCYEQGIGVGNKSKLQAKRLYEKSAETGFVLGKYALAASTLSSGKLAADEAKAFKKLLDDGVAAGLPAASLLSGDAARNGKVEGIEKDIEAAIKHYRKAAELGSASASFHLYEAYSGGWKEWKEKDLKVAGEELVKAAEGGIAEAQLALAKEYFQYEEFSGRLKLKADPEKGVEYAKLAGEQKLLDGYKIVALAIVLERGGEKYDAAKAREYYLLSIGGQEGKDSQWAIRFGKLLIEAQTKRIK